MTRPAVDWPEPGAYLLAVSGGADSMALLDLMAQAAAGREYELTVGHVDHGIRPDSAADRRFVQAAAGHYGLPFAYHEARLPATASEAAARNARYGWLESERRRRGAAAIITAHHEDDLIETSLLNLARGTGRRGLAPMRPAAGAAIRRPLLGVSRAELRSYAAGRDLTWHEDSTNANLANPRNLLRRRLLPAAPPGWRAAYLDAIARLARLNNQIDGELAGLLRPYAVAGGYRWPVVVIQGLSLAETAELIAAAVHTLGAPAELTRRSLNELALFAKTAHSYRRRPLSPQLWLERQPDWLTIMDSPGS